MQPIPVPDDPPDRSIQQLAAARAFLGVLAEVGDLVRRNRLDELPRARLRAVFGDLARAGVPADDCANAVGASTALLASQLNTPGVVAIAATPIPAEPAGPAGAFLALVRPLVALGRVSLQVTVPRPPVLEVVAELERLAPHAIQRDRYSGGASVLVVVEADQVDVTVHVPAPPPPPARTPEQLRDAAHDAGAALAELERIELEGRGLRRGR